MTSVAEAVAALPDDTRVSITLGAGDLTVRDLRAALAARDGPMYLTTHEAAARFGWKSEYWKRAAAAGEIHGAVKDGRWRLPGAACEAHIAAKRLNRRRRGPWSATPSSPPRVGAPPVQEG